MPWSADSFISATTAATMAACGADHWIQVPRCLAFSRGGPSCSTPPTVKNEPKTTILSVGPAARTAASSASRSEEHTSELQSQSNLVCRLLLEKKKRIESIHLVAC